MPESNHYGLVAREPMGYNGEKGTYTIRYEYLTQEQGEKLKKVFTPLEDPLIGPMATLSEFLRLRGGVEYWTKGDIMLDLAVRTNRAYAFDYALPEEWVRFARAKTGEQRIQDMFVWMFTDHGFAGTPWPLTKRAADLLKIINAD